MERESLLEVVRGDYPFRPSMRVVKWKNPPLVRPLRLRGSRIEARGRSWKSVVSSVMVGLGNGDRSTLRSFHPSDRTKGFAALNSSVAIFAPVTIARPNGLASGLPGVSIAPLGRFAFVTHGPPVELQSSLLGHRRGSRWNRFRHFASIKAIPSISSSPRWIPRSALSERFVFAPRSSERGHRPEATGPSYSRSTFAPAYRSPSKSRFGESTGNSVDDRREPTSYVRSRFPTLLQPIFRECFPVEVDSRKRAGNPRRRRSDRIAWRSSLIARSPHSLSARSIVAFASSPGDFVAVRWANRSLPSNHDSTRFASVTSGEWPAPRPRTALTHASRFNRDLRASFQ